MKMILEGSDSAEAFSPWGGGIELHLFSLRVWSDGWCGQLQIFSHFFDLIFGERRGTNKLGSGWERFLFPTLCFLSRSI